MGESLSVPDGLGSRGRARWEEVTSTYDLSGSEVVVLTQLCRLLDRADQLARVLAAEGLAVEGSAGQTRVHPAVEAERATSLAIARLEAQLALPAEDAEPLPSVTVLRARKAADARWQAHRRDVATWAEVDRAAGAG